MSRPKLALFVSALAALAVLSTGTPLVGSGPGQQDDFAYVPGEVIVKFKSLAQPLDKAAARAGLNATRARGRSSPGPSTGAWAPGVDVETAVERLQANPLVEYVEPNYIWTARRHSQRPAARRAVGHEQHRPDRRHARRRHRRRQAWGVSTRQPRRRGRRHRHRRRLQPPRPGRQHLDQPRRDRRQRHRRRRQRLHRRRPRLGLRQQRQRPVRRQRPRHALLRHDRRASATTASAWPGVNWQRQDHGAQVPQRRRLRLDRRRRARGASTPR